MWWVGGQGMHAGFWWGNPRDRDYWEELGTDGRMIV